MTQSIHLSGQLDLTAKGSQRRFKILAYSGGTLRVSGFALPVVVDLAGLAIPESLPILIDHSANVESTLGTADAITNDGRSLSMTGVVTASSSKAQAVLAQHDQGQRWQASIGAQVEQAEEVPAGKTVSVNGQTFTGPLIIARRATLRETSVLPMGADSTTQVNLAAAAAQCEGTHMTFEQFTADLGIDHSTLTASGEAVLRQQFEANNGTLTAESITADLRAAVATDLRRQAQIQAICHQHPDIAAAAIENGWSPTQAENAVLKAGYGRNKVVNSTATRDSGALSQQALTASLMLRANGEQAAVKAFGERTVEIAAKARITNMRDLSAAALQVSGIDPRSFSSDREMLKAAFSTTTLPNILSDSAEKMLEEAYAETTSEWRLFANVASAANFRTHTSIRPQAIDNLDEHPKGGRMKHGSLKEEDTYSWSVSTFSKFLSVTREDIVNDDLRFIDELAPMLGTAAGRTLRDLLWSTILGAQTAGHFASGNANLGEAGSALSVTSLGAGVAAMRKQRDSKGYDIDIRPAVLAVGPTLELTAKALLNSAEIVLNSSTSEPSGNPVQGIVPNLVVEPRLENSARFSNTSTTQWFLFGPPQTKPVTVGFLNGQQTPTIEIEDANFDELGISMRVYHDFGVALGDEKAAYKATGAAGE